uniref:Ig-like domain-containing protein n=1 Tax=Seriola dumerili TaxID=41447 RepID=A0A3B4V9L0_SERDU
IEDYYNYFNVYSHIFIQWPLIYLSLSDGALLYANLGDNVILPCFYSSSAKNLCWYKQVAGEQPQIISSFYKHSFYNIFYNQFKDDKRFSVHTGAGFYHLNISNVQDSDSAMYYCGQTSITVTEFSNGTFLVVKESSCRSFLQQPLSESVQAGGSVSLNGTVHTGTSDGEHSVYWFRKDTGKSHLGILYVHTHSSSRCVKAAGSESPAQSRCVYNLWRRSVSLSDAGTYYCAVASCGEILFGEGTRLEKQYTLPVLLWCVVAALLLSSILNIILVCILCKMATGTYLQSEGE